MLQSENIYGILISSLATMFLSLGLIMAGYAIFRKDVQKRVKAIQALISVLYFVLFAVTVSGNHYLVYNNSEYIIIIRALVIASVSMSLITCVLAIILNDKCKRKKLNINIVLPLLMSVTVILCYCYVPMNVFQIVIISYSLFYLLQISLYIYYFNNKYMSLIMSIKNNVVLPVKFTSITFLSVLCLSFINILTSIFMPYFNMGFIMLNFLFYLVFAAIILDSSYLNNIIQSSDLVVKHTSGEEKPKSNIEDPYSAFFQNWIRRKQYSKAVNRESLSKKMQLNNVEFAQYFKNVHGCSFSVWLNKVRIEEAKKMLVSNADTPVMQVAESVGMSITSFNRSFVNYVGISPSEYRAVNKCVK